MVESTQNKLVKEIRFLQTKKGREETGLFVVEGEKFVDTIPLDWIVAYYLISEHAKVDRDRYEKRAKTFLVKESVFRAVTDTVTPQGILAVCHKRIYSLDSVLQKLNPLFVLCERLADPGNVGTLIRTADAAGFDGVVLSPKSVDVYNSKTVRATAGSIFNIPIFENMELSEFVAHVQPLGVKMVATHLKAELSPYQIDFTTGCAILIGNESIGLSDELAQLADYAVKIPMRGRAESLNASIASGILIYEAVRQRVV